MKCECCGIDDGLAIEYSAFRHYWEHPIKMDCIRALKKENAALKAKVNSLDINKRIGNVFEAARAIKMLCDYAYETGFHEMGYDPLEVIIHELDFLANAHGEAVKQNEKLQYENAALQAALIKSRELWCLWTPYILKQLLPPHHDTIAIGRMISWSTLPFRLMGVIK